MSSQTSEKIGSPSEPEEVSVAQLIRSARPAMLLTGVLTAIGAVCKIVPFIALQQMAAIWLDEPLLVSGWTNPWVWGIVAVVALFLSQVLYLGGIGITHIAEAKLRYRLRTQSVDAIANLPLGKVSEIPHGTIRKMVCDDTTAIHTLVAHVPGDATNAVVSLVAGFGYLLWVDWRFSLVLFGIWILIVAVIAGASMRGYADLTERFGVAQTDLAAATVEMLDGIKEIKNFQATDATRTRFNKARSTFSDISFEWAAQSGKAITLIGALLRPSTIFTTVAVLAFWFTSQGWIPLSATLPFFLVAPSIPEGLTALVGLTHHIYESQMAAKSTAALLSEPPMVEGSKSISSDETVQPDQAGRVEVQNVSFAYEPGMPVIKDVSFIAEPGTVTALVGPSGGGKSTLAKLIARFYDVAAGTITIGGVNVKDLTFASLLSNTSIVLQEVALSNDSVHDNIALGKPGATRDDVEAAAKAAQIHERIMRLPDGYDTVLGEAGGFLSGGERQRVTLARTYLQNTPVLILDEATAQADPESEHAIHQALSKLAKGRTVIVIAHRLATIQDADQILVIEAGRITERGTHPQLLAVDGSYASMWRTQQLSFANQAS